MRLADQQEMFVSENAALCLRYDLGNLPRTVCVGLFKCAVRRPCPSGKGIPERNAICRPLTRLEKAMTAAAAARRYEEAAVLRDQWDALENLHEQLQRFREAQRHYSFIYPVPGREGGCLWYLIRSGQVCLVIDEPHDRETG